MPPSERRKFNKSIFGGLVLLLEAILAHLGVLARLIIRSSRGQFVLLPNIHVAACLELLEHIGCGILPRRCLPFSLHHLILTRPLGKFAHFIGTVLLVCGQIWVA